MLKKFLFSSALLAVCSVAALAEFDCNHCNKPFCRNAENYKKCKEAVKSGACSWKDDNMAKCKDAHKQSNMANKKHSKERKKIEEEENAKAAALKAENDSADDSNN